MINERYSLESALDQVRFGTLYRAIDREQSRYVGLWLLPAELGRNPGALEAFKRDFARIRLLTHPNIARIFELDHDGERYFVITEFLDGETLRNVLDHLRPERLDAEEADAIVTAVGGALAHAHDRGIVHGDIRGENVLVTMSREIKVLNFMSTNTLRYAPFAARPADDVRDLATLAYELYTGYAPHAKRPVRLKGLPRQRWSRSRPRSRARAACGTQRRRFLASAGLREPEASPIERPREALPAAARVAPPRSRWRLGVPALGVAIVGAAFFAAGGMHWMNSAGRDLQSRFTTSRRVGPKTAPRQSSRTPRSRRPHSRARRKPRRLTEPPGTDAHAEEARPAEQRVLPVAAVMRERSSGRVPAVRRREQRRQRCDGGDGVAVCGSVDRARESARRHDRHRARRADGSTRGSDLVDFGRHRECARRLRGVRPAPRDARRGAACPHAAHSNRSRRYGRTGRVFLRELGLEAERCADRRIRERENNDHRRRSLTAFAREFT